MEKQLIAADTTAHEAVHLDLCERELCHDLAREHTRVLKDELLPAREELQLVRASAKRVESLALSREELELIADLAKLLKSNTLSEDQRQRDRRQLDELCERKKQWRAAELEHLALCRRYEKRQTTRMNYERIAESLCCLRPGPLSPAYNLKIRSFGFTREEIAWARDLAAVYDDLGNTLELRKRAQRQLRELNEQIELRNRRHLLELLKLATPFRYHEPKVKRLLLSYKQEGKAKFFDRLNQVIRRYLQARVSGETWSYSLPLLELLTIEWLRDGKGLWRFIEAILKRFESISASTSRHRQKVVANQVVARNGHDWDDTLTHLQAIKAINSPPKMEQRDALMGSLRTRCSRALSDARKSINSGVSEAKRQNRANRWRYKVSGNRDRKHDSRSLDRFRVTKNSSATRN